MRRPLLFSATIVAAMIGLAGCSSAMDSASESGSFEATDQFGEVDGGGATPEVSEDRPIIDPADPASGRQVIVTGSVWLTVEHPLDAADEAAEIVEAAGGHVDNRSETAPQDGDPGRAEMTVRIPSAKVSTTLESLEELGEVEETNTHRQDVTSVAQDLDARITALEASVDRLLALMVEANTTTDLITIESTLSERQSDLESLQSQRRSLADQVDYSTITLHLGSEAEAPVDEPDTFLSGLTAGWEALVAFVSFLLVALGVLLPWLILPAIVLAVLWFVVRRRRRSGRVDPGSKVGQSAASGVTPPATEEIHEQSE